MFRNTSPTQWGASLLLVVAAGTHVPLIGEHLEEAPYVGWLFIALTVACLTLAAAIVALDRPGVWVLSGVTCLAAFVAFLASRTIGLPQISDDVGNWTEPLGFPAAASEVAMLVLAYVHLHRRPLPGRRAVRQQQELRA